MADFEEVLQDAGEGIKKTFKNKPFLLLCIAVGVIALVLWWIRQNNAASSTSSSYYEGEQAIGYGGYGYPSVGGYENSSDEYWQTILDNWEEKLGSLSDKHMEDIDLLKDQHATDIENLNDKWQDKYDALLDKLDNQNDGYINESYTPSYGVSSGGMTEAQIVQQMKENSVSWWGSDEAMQDALHQANTGLASQIGATYHEASGTWWKDGALLYDLSPDAETPVTSMGGKTAVAYDIQYDSDVDYQARINDAITQGKGAAIINGLNEARNDKISASGGSVAQANTYYNKDTDYAALIAQAKAQGASQSVIDNLNAQRNAKIKGENLTQYK